MKIEMEIKMKRGGISFLSANTCANPYTLAGSSLPT